MPAAKPTPLEELAFSQDQLTTDEVTRRYRALTGYERTEMVPAPAALMLLSGTDRPAKAKAKLTRYLQFGILVVDQEAVAKRYIDPTERRSDGAVVAAFTTRRRFSQTDIKQFFGCPGFTSFALLRWAIVFAETRNALRKFASSQAGFQKSDLTHSSQTSETPDSH